MKIVYVVHGYTNSAGTERVLALKANYLVDYGYNVSIISLAGASEPFFYFNPKIKIYHLDIPNKEKNKLIFVEKVEKILEEIKPEISISTGIGISRYLYLAKDSSKKILEMHFAKYRRKFELARIEHTFFGRLLADLYSLKKNRIVKQYDRFVVLTEEDKESWRNIHNLRVVANPITLLTEEYSNLEAKRVIVVGRFTYQKGMDLLIPIWAKVALEFPEWVLSIYGSGDNKIRRKIEQEIQSYNLSDQVIINEPIKNIETEFVKSSVFLLTSRYEGMPLVLLEAMSCGLPVISYACKCGPRDIITNGEDGFLINNGDSDEFAAQLRKLMKDENLRKKMGLHARENVKRFDKDIIMKKWINLFEELMVE